MEQQSWSGHTLFTAPTIEPKRIVKSLLVCEAIVFVRFKSGAVTEAEVNRIEVQSTSHVPDELPTIP